VKTGLEKVEGALQVSVVVVCLNEKNNIKRCIDSLLAQEYDKNNFEILVVDNNSTDGTQETLREFEGKNILPNFRWMVNPKKGIAGSRNIGLREAIFPYVAFTDADCLAPSSWLNNLAMGFVNVKKYDDTVVAVGGANLPPKNTSSFYDALSITLKTYLGNRGSTQGKVFDKVTKVPHMPTVNIMYYRERVLSAGGFDENFASVCEDPELNYRLVTSGYSIYFIPGCHVWHYMRNTLKAYAKNIYKYGRGRIQFVRKHPKHFSVVFLLSPFLVVFILLGNVLGFISPLFFLVNSYFLVLLFVSVGAAFFWRRPLLFGHILMIYISTHLAFGLGEISETLPSKK